jgi:hypothetical protein
MQPNDSEYKITKSKFGKDIVIREGFIFTYKNTGKDLICWRCRLRTCPAPLHIYNNGVRKLRLYNHKAKPDEAEAQILYGVIKQKALMTVSSNKQIYNNEVLKKNLNVKVNRNSIYKTISNIRRRNNVITNDDNIIPINLQYTYKKKFFIRFVKESEKCEQCVFYYTDEFMQYATKSDEWVADGTFLSSPREYSQLYVVYTKNLNKFIPFVYILMKDRKEISDQLKK